MLDVDKIERIISEIPYVSKILSIESNGIIVFGDLEILFEGLISPLEFTFEIYPTYPLKIYGTESIKFINKKLLRYSHVMENGMICIHTSYEMDISKKLLIDFNSLKNWIERYYINKAKDDYYEHIIVNESLMDGIYYSYIFTDTDYEFKIGQFGEVKLSRLSEHRFKGQPILNFLVSMFIADEHEIKCEWSNSFITEHPVTNDGVYIFIGDHPAKYNRFIFKDFSELSRYLPEKFLVYIHTFEKKKKNKDILPLFIGYKTVGNKIHWQIALLRIGNSPIIIDHVQRNNIFIPEIKIKPSVIIWGIARNSSYKYFFGRGSLSANITDGKVLIIGLGAIGSMVAKALVKGGCKHIDIADYDTKEPENVCRSEYFFSTGITEKVYELGKILIDSSPFVEINIFNNQYFADTIKSFFTNSEAKEVFASILNKYSIVIDCTTDNDLMYVLNSLELSCDLINLSITNHAKDLVCAFYPNIFNFVNTQFESILENDLIDLHEPTGCWSPTFKASYVDVNLLVQVAMKQINNIYDKQKQKNNFIVKTDLNDNLKIELVEY